MTFVVYNIFSGITHQYCNNSTKNKEYNTYISFSYDLTQSISKQLKSKHNTCL